MLQLFYKDQKYCFSDPIYRKFDYVHLNHSSCAPGSTRDVCFWSRSHLSEVSQIPLSLSWVSGLRSHAK